MSRTIYSYKTLLPSLSPDRRIWNHWSGLVVKWVSYILRPKMFAGMCHFEIACFWFLFFAELARALHICFFRLVAMVLVVFVGLVGLMRLAVLALLLTPMVASFLPSPCKASFKKYFNLHRVNSLCTSIIQLRVANFYPFTYEWVDFGCHISQTSQMGQIRLFWIHIT